MKNISKIIYSQMCDKVGRIVRKVITNKDERKKLKNSNFTILSQNCIGSIMYHDLGQKFLSPTINMLFNADDFVKFLENINTYLDKEIEFIEEEKYNYPIGKIGDITIKFVHYKDRNEVINKWNERKKRINWNNLYIIACDDNMSDEAVKKFEKLSLGNKLLFTNNKRHLIKDSVYLNNIFEKADARLLNFASLNGKRYYQKIFDYITWINGGKKD